MAETFIGLTGEFDVRDVKVKRVDTREVGIVRLGDEFFAFENTCPHARGPVCQGRLMGRVEEQIAADKTSDGACFSKRDINIVCPWHGYEFDVRTGQHQGHSQLRLRRYEVRVDEDRIYVSL